MTEEKIIKTDPRKRITRLQEDEHTVIEKLKLKEREIRVLISELQALRNLISEAEDEIEDEKYGSYTEDMPEEKKEEKEEVPIERLEEVVGESAKIVSESQSSPIYTSITADKLKTAADEKSIGRLYELAYTSNDWTEEDASEFFDIRDSVFQAKAYELSDTLQQTVDKTYQAVQAVMERKDDQVQQNYNPNLAPPPPTPAVLDTIKKDVSQEYKAPVKEVKKNLKDIL